ncbi:MAG: hypothetical protein GY805_30755 [Chloroflexi bacterium]|nr:hypothetical protein [Chloroflexota bacterium]
MSSSCHKNLPFIALSILAVLLGMAFFLIAETSPNIADSIGYAYAGERLAAGHGVTYDDPNNRLTNPYFSLFAFQIKRPNDNRMFLGYPPGFPLLLAAGIILTGHTTFIHYVTPLLAIIGIVGSFYLGQLVTGNRQGGLWAALILAALPAYWQFSTAAWSEVPSMTFIVIGYGLYLLSRQEERPLSHKTVLSILAGLVISYSFFIRYANVFFIPALGLYELATARSAFFKIGWRWIFFGLLAIALGGILLFNHMYYGGMFLTSYSPEHGWYPQPAFSLSYALGPSFVNGYSLKAIANTLWENFSFLLLLVPVGWLWLKRPFAILVILSSIVPMALYAVYAFAAEGINGRFLIPSFPFIAIVIAQALNVIGQKLPATKWRWAFTAILILIIFWPIPQHVQALHNRKNHGAATSQKINEMVGDMPEHAVFLSYVYNDHIIYYGHRSVLNYRRIPVSDPALDRYHWEMVEPCAVQTIHELQQQGTPVYYIEDQSPPFLDLLAKLQGYFTLELVKEAPNIYQVTTPIEPIKPDPNACLP